MHRAASASRRAMLAFLAASPLAAGVRPALAQTDPEAELRAALNVFDLRKAAERTVRPAHWGYLETGVQDDLTVEANRTAFNRWGIRARRMVDVSRVDTSTEVLGQAYKTPIGLAPVSAQRAFHHDGERPAARAAGTRGALQMISTLATVSFETLVTDRNGPLWFQLYPTGDLKIAERLVKRADAAGAAAIVLTIDLLTGGMRREMQARLARSDGGNCQSCHDRSAGFADYVRRKPMFQGVELGAAGFDNPSLTWDVVKRLRDWTQKPVLVKGVMTAEDAELALAAGAQGLVVSNHGGRAEESLIGTLDVLPEIAATVGKRAPILFDGGVRRGTDVFKALALGASIVCVGRPYIWGLAGYGQAGVEASLDLIGAELVAAMQQAGVTRISQIDRNCVTKIS
jgi:4-hydroxymandelate oxidase